MPNQLAKLDGVYQALASPARRHVIAELGRGPTTMSALAEPFDMALPSFLQHLQILENRGMITSSKSGRTRTYSLVPHGLVSAEDWLSEQRSVWSSRLDRLDDLLHKLKESES
ncbi:MAG: helix-turn-helix transcriptional regulator [Fimbriimonadaceae bacterium]|nr:helix-turn-helix transcriptional regulator [Fimbriimonadaceae bacterium]